MSRPYSDDKMVYNFEAHRYVLTEEYCSNQLNVNIAEVLNTAGVADIANAPERFLDRISRIIYSYIYSINAFKYETERKIAQTEQCRKPLMNAMGEQVLYTLNNGDFTAIAGVNAQTGATLDKKALRGAEIAPLSKDELINSGIVCAVRPRWLQDIIPLYDEEGY